MALYSPKDLTTALCQACGEAPKLGYFGHFGVILTKLPTAANGRQRRRRMASMGLLIGYET